MSKIKQFNSLRAFSLLIAFFRVTYAGNTIRVFTYFTIGHAVAPFSTRKPCIVAGAVSQAGRRLALTRRQFEETFRSRCFCH